MDLITPKDFLSANKYLKYLGGEKAARYLMKVTRLQEFNARYNPISHLKGPEFIDAAIDVLGFRFDFHEEDLQNLPKKGPFITVSNHPYGGLDGILLMKIIPMVRPDFKILVNFLLTKMGPIDDYFLAVNPFESYKDVKSSLSGLREAFHHLRSGAPLSIYPAGEVSTYRLDKKEITDRTWQMTVIKFIKKAKVPVVPLFFSGHNSKMFHFLGIFHPMLRTVKLASELFNKEDHMVNVRIGRPVSVEEQNQFADINEYRRFLRNKTYSLRLSLSPLKKIAPKESFQHKIAGPAKHNKICEEIKRIEDEYLLFRIKSNLVFCVPSPSIPNIMHEIGRLREITYREVGEGTNSSLDIDQYDEYYEQLFIWDEEEEKIVGGYRVGKGKDILSMYGIKGLYINSLFRISQNFLPVLRETIELGRSFIVKEYQRKTISLFLLWKGILYLLLKNPEYRYLIGPVSISNMFSNLAKSLTVNFLKENYFNYELAENIFPRKRFKVKIDKTIDTDIFIKETKGNVAKLDRFIQSFEPDFRLPVLIKKYLQLNAEVIGFNVDPKFNSCLDGLIILDLLDVPIPTIENLSKELDDKSILERFKK